MLIYRLESNIVKSSVSDRVMRGSYNGPYNRAVQGGCRTIADIALPIADEAYNSKHPSPFGDPLLRNIFKSVYHGSYIFAFENLEQLYRWFNDREGMVELESLNIAQIGVYEVSDQYVELGTYQLIAKANECLLIKTENICQIVVDSGS